MRVKRSSRARNRGIRTFVLRATVAGLLSIPLGFPAFADETAQYQLALAPQSLLTALQQLTDQSGTTLLISPKVTQAFDTPVLKGRYTLPDALHVLLGGTGLTFRYLNDTTIVVQPPTDGRVVRTANVDSPPVGRAAILVAQNDAAAQTPSAPPAAADEGGALEEVTVTGSRIRRKDLTSDSPLVTVDSAQIEQRAGLNLESYLNQLPNFSPAQTPTTENQDVQPSAVNTVGISTISLRGFGPNRSLVLVDGHRTTPVNALMVTDINSIPAAMIDRVEIITGGASAVYGADAIGGVTNFITKKNFQGAQIDVQDGITQAGDGNELRVSTLMGSKIADGRGNILMGLEYYDRDAAYQKNRTFFTDAYTDPNAPQGSGAQGSRTAGLTAINNLNSPPSVAAMNALFASRVAAGGSPLSFGSSGANGQEWFNNNGSIFTQVGGVLNSNYMGPTESNGYGLMNQYNNTMANNAASAPNEVQSLKWSNPNIPVSEPQTRYSFFANGNFDVTDKVQFYTNARFSQSLTTTQLSQAVAPQGGWEATVPYNAATDSPIDPSLLNKASTAAQLSAIVAAFTANPTNNPYTNAGFIPIGTKGAQHPVPWQLALLLNTRGPAPNGSVPTIPASSIAAGTQLIYGAPVQCQPQIPASACSTAPTSWAINWQPYLAVPQRTTVDQSTSWQIETGFRFPLMVSDWTGDVYYSRGQSANYEQGLGNLSLQRYRAVVDSPGYGQGLSIQGNANGAVPGFGTSVPTTCTSGFYNTFFGGDANVPSANCLNAIESVLQTDTGMQQDIVEGNFQGTLFKGWAGDVSSALGFQYRRDAGQFTPDTLQSTNSFLDEPVGLYPLGTLLEEEFTAREGYAEFLVPLVSNLRFLKSLNLDTGIRYSSYGDTPNAVTFKVNMDAQITNSLRLRAGFNRATRAPNLGELGLGEQEYFGSAAAFGDPCSVRSTAPFGAGGAAADVGPSKGSATKVASGQTAAGALSTYLICEAQMGGAGSAGALNYYTQTVQSQSGGGLAYLNAEGNPDLRSETADTWTAGFVISQLSDKPLLAGFSASLDWWQVNIQNAIELSSPDNANFACYGTNVVTTPEQAAAQAATPACQNVGRSLATGIGTTSLLQYTNQATIGTAGVDLQLNWIAQLSDLGLTRIPGAVSVSSQDSFLSYYRTKNSPGSYDVLTNWKDSLGPTLAGTNPGAYGYRLFTSVGYALPDVSFSFRWRFLPSVNAAAYATQEAIIENNNKVAAGGGGTLLSYVPTTAIAAPAWSAFDLSFNWNINSTFSLRGGVNNLLNTDPAVTGASRGFPVGTNLANVCGAATARGCVNPSSYSLPNDGAGTTNAGFYDVYGRTFFLGAKAQF
jgi:iron complex outermembrane recepter protein